MSNLETMWIEMRNPKKMYKRLFSEEEDLDYITYRYRIIDKLISIKVL